MQRPPYNSGFPNNNPMGPNGFQGQQMPPNQGFGPGRPFPPGAQYGPPGAQYGPPGSQFGPPGVPPGMPQQNFSQQPGCFMPAATIRKISNTTPPKFDPNTFQ